jgi:hypothetical protein
MHTTALQLDRTPPNPTVTPQNSDVVPCACIPATSAPSDHNPAATALIDRIPVDPNPSDVACTPSPNDAVLTIIALTNLLPVDLAPAPAAPTFINPDPGDKSVDPDRTLPAPNDYPSTAYSPIVPIPVPVDPALGQSIFANTIPIDPDPGDVHTAHIAHVNSVCIDSDPIISTSSIQLLSLLLLALSSFFGCYFHSLGGNFFHLVS